MSYSTRRPSAVGQYLSMAPPRTMGGNRFTRSAQYCPDSILSFFLLLCSKDYRLLCLVHRRRNSEDPATPIHAGKFSNWQSCCSRNSQSGAQRIWIMACRFTPLMLPEASQSSTQNPLRVCHFCFCTSPNSHGPARCALTPSCPAPGKWTGGLSEWSHHQLENRGRTQDGQLKH